MLIRNKLLILVAAIAFLTGVSIDVYAKGSSGGGGGRSFSSSSSKSFSTSSKPSSTSSVSSTKPSSSSSFTSKKSLIVWGGAGAASKPNTYGKNAYASVPAGVSGKQGFGGTSVFDKTAAQKMRMNTAVAAKQTAAADVSKFKKPAVPLDKKVYVDNPAFKSVKVSPVSNYSSYKRDRTSYYSKRNWNAPNYAYRGSSSYGAYDGLFMWMMLDSVSDAAMMSMYYNHASDPAFTQWRAEAETLAKENKELEAKLAALDAKVGTMTGEKDPNYMAAGIPATVMLASDVLDNAAKEEIPTTVMSGGSTGVYTAWTKLLAREAKGKLAINEVQEPSLVTKLSAFENGKTDIIIGPADGIDTLTWPKASQYKSIVASSAVLYKEATLFLTHVNSGIKNMSDIDDTCTVIIGAEGSGTAIEWLTISRTGRTSEQYAAAKTAYVSYNNPDDALKLLAEDTKVVIMYVGGLNSKFIRYAEEKALEYNIRLMSMDDDRVSEILMTSTNTPMYTQSVVPENKYPNLQRNLTFMGMSTHRDIITYTVDATMLVHKDWVAKNGQEALDELVAEVVAVQPQIETLVHGLDI